MLVRSTSADRCRKHKVARVLNAPLGLRQVLCSRTRWWCVIRVGFCVWILRGKDIVRERPGVAAANTGMMAMVNQPFRFRDAGAVGLADGVFAILDCQVQQVSRLAGLAGDIPAFWFGKTRSHAAGCLTFGGLYKTQD